MMLPSCIPAKRAEMTFGYLHSHIPADLTPDSSGSVALYEPTVMRDKLLELDPYFIGMRRSTIDRVGVIRQAIAYTLFSQQLADGTKLYATYQRSSGSDAKLEGSWSIGFGGHVELEDICYYKHLEPGTHIEGVVDSHATILLSAERELEEEVEILSNDNNPLSFGLELPVNLIGFITDYKPEVEGWIGNTHLGILAEVVIHHAILREFNILESKYTFLGWKSLEELKNNQHRLESWSALTVDAL